MRFGRVLDESVIYEIKSIKTQLLKRGVQPVQTSRKVDVGEPNEVSTIGL